MLALEHLHADALLVVLIGAALAIVTLRAAVHLCHRALVARDRAIIATITSKRAHDERQLP
jgi:hypothetical protein